jgi:hypothetical protein
LASASWINNHRCSAEWTSGEQVGRNISSMLGNLKILGDVRTCAAEHQDHMLIRNGADLPLVLKRRIRSNAVTDLGLRTDAEITAAGRWNE